MNRHTRRGCTALVTGAASGLGKGLADALVSRASQCGAIAGWQSAALVLPW
jgi:NAD(P)-dependent dehydrogenase (short-subunit alcohol dehydrogenase family)